MQIILFRATNKNYKEIYLKKCRNLNGILKYIWLAHMKTIKIGTEDGTNRKEIGKCRPKSNSINNYIKCTEIIQSN